MTYEDRLHKSDWMIADVPIAEARSFIELHHYAKGASRTRVYIHGLYDKDGYDLRGLVWWLPPTRAAAETVNKERWRQVLGLSRMAVAPGVPKSACSFLLGASTRIIKQDKRFVSLVTYADEAEGHNGHVYRACGWTYVGRTGRSAIWKSATGRRVHLQSTFSRTTAEMLALGYERTGWSAKHKFVKHLS